MVTKCREAVAVPCIPDDQRQEKDEELSDNCKTSEINKGKKIMQESDADVRFLCCFVLQKGFLGRMKNVKLTE